MIIELSVENFLSIKDKVTLSLEASASKKLPENLIDGSLLKSAVIYGANASGKSNLLRAILFMWQAVKLSHTLNVENKIPRVPFKLDQSTLTQPSKFEILFIYNSVKYKYSFSCTNDKIIDESLYYWPHGRAALIFGRTDTNNYKFKSDKRKFEQIRKQMNDNVLFLSRATALGNDKTKPAYEFIVNNVVINYHPVWVDMTLKKIYDEPILKNKILEILQKADFGGILDIKVQKETRKLNRMEFKVEKNMPSLSPVQQVDEDVYNTKFLHKRNDGQDVELTFDEESSGTEKTFGLLGGIFDVLDNGKVMLIDELESSLHPSITQFLVRLFNSKHNKKNAQLIFTTHDTNLLNSSLFRRDQIYVCTKKPNKHTLLSSLLDFDLREDTNLEKAYLNGRVGGIPFIDETFFDND